MKTNERVAVAGSRLRLRHDPGDRFIVIISRDRWR